MATLDQEDDKLKQGQSDGGGAYIGGGSGQGATTGINSDSPSSSGNYTNLQNYLTANEGNDTLMGQGAAGVANAAGQGAVQAMDTMQNNANSQISSGTVNVDPEKEKQIAFDPGAGFQGRISNLSKGGTDSGGQYNYGGPSSVNTTYGGPQSYNEINGALDTAGKVGNAQSVADQSKTTPGVSTLLKSAYGQPGYSSGENQLDTLVTQSGTGGQGQLNKIGQDWGGITDTANNMYGGIQSQIQAGKDTSAATGAKYAGDIAQAQKDVGAANSQIDSAKTQGQAYLKQKAIDDQNARDAAAAKAAQNGLDYLNWGKSVTGAATPTKQAPTGSNWDDASAGHSTNGPAPLFAAFGGKVPYNKYSGISNMLNGRKK